MGELRTDSVTAAAALVASGAATLVRGEAGPASRIGRVWVEFVLTGNGMSDADLEAKAGLVTLKQERVEPFAYDSARRSILAELRDVERQYEIDHGNGGHR